MKKFPSVTESENLSHRLGRQLSTYPNRSRHVLHEKLLHCKSKRKSQLKQYMSQYLECYDKDISVSATGITYMKVYFQFWFDVAPFWLTVKRKCSLLSKRSLQRCEMDKVFSRLKARKKTFSASGLTSHRELKIGDAGKTECASA